MSRFWCVWAILAMIAIAANFEVSVWISAALCAIGVYILFSDVLIRLMGWNRG